MKTKQWTDSECYYKSQCLAKVSVPMPVLLLDHIANVSCKNRCIGSFNQIFHPHQILF